MKPINAATHGYLDFLTVLVFAAAPSVLGLHGLPATLCWVLAFVHLGLTLLTDFPMGWRPIIPFWIHGWIERIVGPVLILLAFIPSFSNSTAAFAFYELMGFVILAVSFLTDYSASSQTVRRS